ncbi:LLM class flavin-dependent oxidoreductase [Mesorhizobium sp. YM1C-6-2]|uniref:LLM class flavin-dependent oxidoreductase n=1 Tax=Mesorhizobium sp. YM1C-6-2 TaxID=1827501 RepID=UPI000EF1F843|nr:LLM class flavin-dependent oxidoreductase [Mesorhizobium sp. YM1C-6-2]RLP28240.1 LLM class flavin-dependent oxidoreductase [Mesorhizobium sp. YM1C-6-2]
MSVEFTHVPSGNSYPWQYLSSGRDARALRPVLESVFGTIVIDGPAGILTNMDIAAEAARTTSIPGIALTHWSGVIDPVVASRQIAALDRLADGRLSLRFLFGPDGHAGEEAEQIDHAEALRQTDEYLVLLKRLWSNDLPFDHEGPNYSVSGGFVERKGPQGADIPIRMGGVSGIALNVAGRHATVFELTPGTVGEIRDLMRRVETAAARYGRTGKIRFALPVLFTPAGQAGHPTPSGAVAVSGPPARVAQTLLGYAALGICEFMVSGLDDESAISMFSRDVASLFQRTVPILAARRDAGYASAREQSGIGGSRGRVFPPSH